MAPKFKVSAKSGNAAGFSNIPGATNYSLSFGKQFASGFKKGKKLAGTKPGKPVGDKPKGDKPKGEVIQDPPRPDSDGEPTKPKKVKARNATTSDVEKAVAGGFITPEEATGGEWGKDAGLSTTYSKKYAANTAANDGKAVGKQFTGVRAGSKTPGRYPGSPAGDTAAIWDKPADTPKPAPIAGDATSKGNYPNIGSVMDKPAPEQKPSDGSYMIAPGPSTTMLSNESKKLGGPARGKQFP